MMTQPPTPASAASRTLWTSAAGGTARIATSGGAGAHGRGVVGRVDVPSPAAVDATGVVSRVDPQAGTITLQDGRVLHVTPRTTLWQPVPMTSVTPGASIHVRGGAPIDFRP